MNNHNDKHKFNGPPPNILRESALDSLIGSFDARDSYGGLPDLAGDTFDGGPLPALGAAKDEFSGDMYASTGAGMYNSNQKLVNNPQVNMGFLNNANTRAAQYEEFPINPQSAREYIPRTGRELGSTQKPMINIQSADSAIDLDEESEMPGPPLIAPLNDDKIRRPDDNLASFMMDMSSVVNNESIVVMLNNDSMAQRSIYDKELDALGGASGGQGPNSAASGSEHETVIPTSNQDPPVTLEEALTLIQGDPDTYTNRILFIIANLLSTCGFMTFITIPFVFAEPKLECKKKDVNINFRCSAQQACTLYRDSYKIVDIDKTATSFISQFNILCEHQNMDSKQLFALFSGLFIISQLLTGYFSDRYGRKRVIVIKSALCVLFLLPLILLGFIEGQNSNAAFAFYFMALLTATYSFDLMLFGYECLPKANRENYIIVLAATRVLGIALVALCFYFMSKWVYFFIFQAAIMATLVFIFAKKSYESPLYIMASSGDHDMCKFVLNSIAIINEEDIVQEQIAFTTPASTILPSRNLKGIFKASVADKSKFFTLSVVAICWFAYVTAQMTHFVFLDKLQLNIFIDVIILGTTEFLATLLSKVIFKHLTRRVSMMLAFLFILLCYFFMLIFGPKHTQTKYIVTISTRAALQILYILLTVTSIEQFPTEVRATSLNLCMCFGLLGGVSLPFFNEFGTELIVLMVFIFAASTIGSFFMRETKKEEELKNLYSEIYIDQQSAEFDGMRNQDPNQEGQPKNQASVMFDNILNELSGVGKEDNSKMGTLAGNALDFKTKLQTDFNAPLFEQFEPLDEEAENNYDASSDDNDSSDEERKKQSGPRSSGEQESSSELDDSDYDEMEFNEDNSNSRWMAAEPQRSARSYQNQAPRRVAEPRYNLGIGFNQIALQRSSQQNQEDETPTARSTHRQLREQSTIRSTTSNQGLRKSQARSNEYGENMFEEERMDHEEMDMLTEENDIDIDDNER